MYLNINSQFPKMFSKLLNYRNIFGYIMRTLILENFTTLSKIH